MVQRGPVERKPARCLTRLALGCHEFSTSMPELHRVVRHSRRDSRGLNDALPDDDQVARPAEQAR
jgi:hypothetical protein